MNKAFTREVDRDDEDDDGDVEAPVLPGGAKNYITAAGQDRCFDVAVVVLVVAVELAGESLVHDRARQAMAR